MLPTRAWSDRSVDNGTTTITDTNDAPAFSNMQAYGLQPENWSKSSLSIVVVGASGDLARKKIFPALFALYYEGMLPEHFFVYGFSRTNFTDAEFRDTIVANLTCRLDHAHVQDDAKM